MADEIRQVLGFDVTEALTNLDRLGKGISNVSGRLTRFGNNIAKFNTQVSGISPNMLQAGTAANRMAAGLNTATGASQRLTTSAALLSRIIFTQLVIKGLRLAERALFDATKRAADLEVMLTRIQTIAQPGTFSGIEDLQRSISNIGSQLGFSDLEVAEGLYAAVQNQIGGTKEELLEFNRVAGQFAVATLTEQKDAIELLSSTLNAYNLDVSRAEELASKFNTAIEVGSIEGAELAHVFGRVSTRAAALGITIDEVLGLFETLTIRGINPNEAATQIGALISAFAKPSEGMKEALRSLNAPSGEFLIRMEGIVGAMEKVTATTDGSASAVARLFPNIRAVNGVAITASDNFERLAANIEATRNTALGLNEQRFGLIFETDAKQVEAELENLRRGMESVGREILILTANTFDYVGGAQGLIQTVQLATPVVAGLTAQMLLYRQQTLAAAAATTAFGKAKAAVFGLAGTASLVGGITFAATDFGIDALVQQSLKAFNQIETVRQRQIENFKDGEQERLRAAREADEDIVRSALQAIQPQIEAFNESRDTLIRREKEFVTVTQQSLNRVINFRTELLREVEQAISESTERIEDSIRRIDDLRFEQDDLQFNFENDRRSDPAQIDRLLQRSRQIGRQAANDLASAVNERDISNALKRFDASQQSAEQARAIAERIGSRGLEARAVDELNRLLDQQIRAETQLQQVQDQREDTQQRQLLEQQAITDQVQAQAKIILENLSTIESTPDEVARRQQTVREALADLTQSALSSSDVTLAESLGLTQLAADIERAFGTEVRLNVNVNETIQTLQDQLQAAFDNFQLKLNFDTGEFERVLGRDLESISDIPTGLEELQQEADQLRTDISAAQQAQFALTNQARAQVRELLSSTDSIANQIVRATETSFLGSMSMDEVRQAEQLMQSFRDSASLLASQQLISPEEISGLTNVLFQLDAIAGDGFGLDKERFAQVIQIFQGIEQATQIQTEVQEQRLREIESILNNTGTAIEGSLTRGADQIRASADYAADRLERAITTTEAVTRRFGGMSHLATGGLARGTDTVPAMLTRGEFVMNHSASQRFFSDLQRMNAGMEPSYRNAGGSVDNSVTVGDVHIHGSNQQMTPRDVARAIDREVRRKTLRG